MEAVIGDGSGVDIFDDLVRAAVDLLDDLVLGADLLELLVVPVPVFLTRAEAGGETKPPSPSLVSA
jgi:hypothetical protein